MGAQQDGAAGLNLRTLKSIARKIPFAVVPYRWWLETAERRSKWRRFEDEFRRFRAMGGLSPGRHPMTWEDRYPWLDDNTPTTGFDAHYVYHPAWAARVLSRTRPGRHVDISSTLHFGTIVSAFVPVEFYDYRPAGLTLSDFTTGRADLTDLPFADGSVSSLSCMHVVEHVGLGRYGDPLDPDGDLKAMRELRRVLAPLGTLLFVVPVGRPRVQFNAHRIYSYGQVIDAFDGLELKDFSLILDDGTFVENAPPAAARDLAYGCGCFWFTRPSARAGDAGGS